MIELIACLALAGRPRAQKQIQFVSLVFGYQRYNYVYVPWTTDGASNIGLGFPRCSGGGGRGGAVNPGFLSFMVELFCVRACMHCTKSSSIV